MTINAEQCARLIAEIKNPQWDKEIYTMTTPIQSLMQTIAEYIHDPAAQKGDDVAQWGWSSGRDSNGVIHEGVSIQYAIGPDDTHDSREYRVITVTEEQALDLAILVVDAYNAGWSAGWEAKR